MSAAAELPSPTANPAFHSLADIKMAHLQMMRMASEAESVWASSKRNVAADSSVPIGVRLPDAPMIRGFLDKACRTGIGIARESERRAAQRIIDYWSAELQSRAGLTSTDVRPARLDSFDGADTAEKAETAEESATSTESPGAEPATAGEPAAAADPQAAPTKSPPPQSGAGGDPAIEQERLHIRIAAQARQWVETGFDGYLLRGQALAEAIKIPGGPDIDQFIEASAKMEADSKKSRGRTKNMLITLFALFSAVAVGLAVIAYLQRDAALKLNGELSDQIDQTSAALKEAQDDRKRAMDAQRLANDALQQAQDALVRARQRADEATKRADELSAAQSAFGTAIRIIAQQLAGGHLPLQDLGLEIRQPALVELVNQVKSGSLKTEKLPKDLFNALAELIGKVPTTLPDSLPGYQANFLDAAVPAPSPSGTRGAIETYEPVNYLHYSVLLSRSRRSAVYAAVNVDRSSRLILQNTGGRMVPDRRVSPALQPDPRWFDGELVAAPLASLDDIAWGQDTGSDPGEAGLALSLNVNVLTNATPQRQAFNRGVWAGLEDWVRNQHNPLANRVTIFTGPVFGEASPPGGGAELPVAYWKVAVSAVPTAVKGEARDPEFAVDAFLIPRQTDYREFSPDRFRIAIAKLEAMTHLDFGDLIGWTDSLKNPGPDGTAGEALANRLRSLGSLGGGERLAVLRAVTDVLSNRNLPVGEVQKVVAALVPAGTVPAITALDKESMGMIVEALLSVPPTLWLRPDWLAIYAGARRAAADLNVAAPDVAADTLKRRLAIQPSSQTVYVQFAVMPRPQAQRLSAKLRALGWNIPMPGEERIAAAEGLNEVRYSAKRDADRRAAELLAADLAAAGHPVSVRPLSIIVPNVLEIWISK